MAYYPNHSYRPVVTVGGARKAHQRSHWPGSVAGVILIVLCALMVYGLLSVPRAERAPLGKQPKVERRAH